VTGRARQAGVRIDDILCEVNDVNVYQNRSAIDIVKEARWPRKLVFLRPLKNSCGKRGCYDFNFSLSAPFVLAFQNELFLCTTP
jgi:hypothetical protein